MPGPERRGVDEPPTERAGARLRVATYNIHKGVIRDLFGLKRVSSVHELRARLHELDADLIFLQEVQGKNDRHATRFAEKWPGESQEQFLAHSPTLQRTFESAYGRNASYLHGHHGNALLSRYPIVRRENRDFSDHALEKRGVLHCVVRIDRRNVHCFVIHFGLFAKSRERQAEALVDWIVREVPRRAPLLLAGDFNDWRDRLSRRFVESLQVTEVMGGARTFPALVPWLRMDRIYQRGFDVHGADVLRGPSWARLSDHAPLVADLRLVR
ncbi:MAG TPA: endonuclease/exonuclease/phosphatase family protein [Burkholderiaceae bacterium]|nr:endonuclease/exonuclease/phosphatase family protein [Burkholderiaceae bacterium]